MENPQCAADTMAGTADPPSDALAFTELAVGIQNRRLRRQRSGPFLISTYIRKLKFIF